MSKQPDLDQKLQQIELSCRYKANHLLSGHYHSAFKGQGIEFDEVRQYAAGDDVRHIDWNVTARTGDVYIKRFHEERELNLIFVVDNSPSFIWSSQEQGRLEVAIQLCALLGNAALGNNDRIGLLQYSNDVDSYLPPTRGRSQLMRCLTYLLEVNAQAKASHLHLALERLNQMPLKRSIVVIISDFFDLTPQSPDWEMLAILAQQHEVLALALDDPAELSLQAKGLLQLQDCESSQQQLIDSSNPALNQLFQQQMQKRLHNRVDEFAKYGIDLIAHRLKDDPIATLLDYFQSRRLRARNETGGA